MTEPAESPVASCAGCNTQIADGLLACPACGQLLHADRLKSLAADAERAAAAEDFAAALGHWRSALALLPPDSRQHRSVLSRIDALSRKVPAGVLEAQAQARARAERDRQVPGWAKRAGPLGALGMLAWKFKFLVALVLGQGKLLLLGLTKGSTLLSMLLSVGIYWTVFGWKFAVGLIASIYIHEMGHVAALRKHGIPASAPMFIPGFGAVVRLKQYPVNPVEDARVGLAGPLWGMAAAIGSFLIYKLTGIAVFAALARAGAFINLFNLVPVWQLDGSRGFAALDKGQRWLCAAAMAMAWAFSGENLLLLLVVASVLRAVGKAQPAEGDRSTLLTFVMLLFVLAALAVIDVPRIQ